MGSRVAASNSSRLASISLSLMLRIRPNTCSIDIYWYRSVSFMTEAPRPNRAKYFHHVWHGHPPVCEGTKMPQQLATSPWRQVYRKSLCSKQWARDSPWYQEVLLTWLSISSYPVTSTLSFLHVLLIHLVHFLMFWTFILPYCTFKSQTRERYWSISLTLVLYSQKW